MIEPRVYRSYSHVTTDDRNEIVGQKEDLWFEGALGEDWVLAIRFAAQDGEAVVAELRIFPSDGTLARQSMEDPSPRDPGEWVGGETEGIRSGHRVPRGGLPAGLLRDVKFLTFRSKAVEILNRIREIDGRDPFDPDGAFTAVGLSSGPALADPKRPGRPGRSRYFYAEMAARYADLCGSGERNVVSRMAEEFGYTTEGVKTIISRARQLDLLTPAVRGRASGALTDEGRRVLTAGPPE